MIMWVDDTITILARGKDQRILVDQRTYFRGVLRVSAPDKKAQHSSMGPRCVLRFPDPAAVDAHVGRSRVTASPQHRERAPQPSAEPSSAPV